MWSTWRAKKVRERSANCMVSGGGGGWEAQKGASVPRGGKESGGCGARVQEREWWCGEDDEGVAGKARRRG